jgi:hypothetical protein
MNKHGAALLAALLISVIVGLGMIVIGGNAALNPNGAPPSNSPAASDSSGASSVPQTAQTEIEQLQSLVA